ncbi:MAG: hypothetical protein FWG84_03850 [Bacteroidales bacterium]|nr:hypothetical protein [Bacteroidales bacterium]
MKPILITVFCVFCVPFVVLCSNPWRPSGARQAGLGGASVGVSDLWSASNNQAGMAFFQLPAAGVYFTNAYFLEQLSTKSIVATMPIKSGAFGVTANYFGHAYHNEINAGLSYAQRFGKSFAAAVQLDYLHFGQGGYNDLKNKDNVSFELSIMGQVTKNLSVGAHVFNPVGVKYNDYAIIPACYRVGLGWFPVKEVLIAAEVEMQTNEKENIKLGVEYTPLKIISIRTGFSSAPQLWDFGVGLNLKDFSLDLTPTWDMTLGWSTHVSVSYQFNKYKQ